MNPLYWLIDFINKVNVILLLYSMHPSTPQMIKKISLQASPRIPSILQSKNRQHGTENINRHSHTKTPFLYPKYTLIDAYHYNQQFQDEPLTAKKRSNGIRGEIDTCLHAVGRAYDEQCRKSRHLVRNQVLMKGQAIHRVDSFLIMKFIDSVNKDYGFPKNFPIITSGVEPQEYGTNQKLEYQQQDPRLLSIQKRRQSSRKTFLSLTLSSSSHKQFHSTNKRSGGTISPSASKPSPLPNPVESRKIHESKKILQQFKICVACQKKILVENIAYHQQNQCRQIKKLYEMSFSQIESNISDKVQNMCATIKNSMKSLKSFEPQKQGQICQVLLQKISDYLKISQMKKEQALVRLQQVQNTCNNLQQKLSDPLGNMIETLQKLEYFLKILTNLKIRRDEANTQELFSRSIMKNIKQGESRFASPIQQIRKSQDEPKIIVVEPISHFEPISD